MGFLRRHAETLNEQLLREAGLEPAVAPEPEPSRPDEPAPRRTYDTLVVAHAPELAGSSVAFVALPTGDLIVESEQGDADLSPLADAVERNIRPPYRGLGVRQTGDLWGVDAKPLDVRRFACEAGDEIELVSRGGAVTLTVDGEPSSLRIPELEPDGDAVVYASRIDGDFWEVEATRL